MVVSPPVEKTGSAGVPVYNVAVFLLRVVFVDENADSYYDGVVGG